MNELKVDIVSAKDCKLVFERGRRMAEFHNTRNMVNIFKIFLYMDFATAVGFCFH